MTEQSENEGYIAGRQGRGSGQNSSMTGLLEQVEGATTLGGGLTTLRTGIAGVLAGALDPNITQDGYPASGDDTGGTGGQHVDVETLSQLYQSLLIDNDEWADALIANTPMAQAAGQGATASRSAFA